MKKKGITINKKVLIRALYGVLYCPAYSHGNAAWHAKAWHIIACRGMAWHRVAWHGTPSHGMTWYGTPSHGMAG